MINGDVFFICKIQGRTSYLWANSKETSRGVLIVEFCEYPACGTSNSWNTDFIQHAIEHTISRWTTFAIQPEVLVVRQCAHVTYSSPSRAFVISAINVYCWNSIAILVKHIDNMAPACVKQRSSGINAELRPIRWYAVACKSIIVIRYKCGISRTRRGQTSTFTH